MWWELTSGYYVNGSAALWLTASISDSVWWIRVNGNTALTLKGSYASEADAQEAMRKLCQGFDPSTIA